MFLKLRTLTSFTCSLTCNNHHHWVKILLLSLNHWLPDFPAELGLGPDSENCGAGGIWLMEPLLDGRFTLLGSGVRGIFGRDPKAAWYSGFTFCLGVAPADWRPDFWLDGPRKTQLITATVTENISKRFKFYFCTKYQRPPFRHKLMHFCCLTAEEPEFLEKIHHQPAGGHIPCHMQLVEIKPWLCPWKARMLIMEQARQLENDLIGKYETVKLNFKQIAERLKQLLQPTLV